MSWKLLQLSAEGESVLIGGVNVWDTQWKTQGEEAVAAEHPAYPGQKHRLNRYFIEAAGKSHEFAAGEVSPGVWLFFVPSKNTENTIALHIAAYIVGTAGCFIMIHGYEHSPSYLVLGAVLLAVALGAEWYAKSRRIAGEA